MAFHTKDKDAYQRLNYLYQAAHCVLSQTPENVELARFYCFTQKTIARRLVLRQDPSVKRQLCKKCCSLLIPGVTATTRQRNSSPSLKKTPKDTTPDGTVSSKPSGTQSTAST
ncbi:ribonuclease P protein subunit p21 isoform X2 [Micropterus salmoides]|uniref:ribonuclease P protein subunit p21 isoform X2 n=1 Tax=Micropterus salmoides TaxID=27706 RepID=UPI0018EAEA67|nr:ribonuclease P protein subunit p21 isoform X2 [Micropterus salmoides]